MRFFDEKKTDWQNEDWGRMILDCEDYTRRPISFAEYCERAENPKDIYSFFNDVEQNLDNLTIMQRVEICIIAISAYALYLNDADNVDIKLNKFDGERLSDWIGLEKDLYDKVTENEEKLTREQRNGICKLAISLYHDRFDDSTIANAELISLKDERVYSWEQLQKSLKTSKVEEVEWDSCYGANMNPC